MKNLFSAVLTGLLIYGAVTVYEYLYPSVMTIEHIENVDEMEPTPEEIYIFTSNGKYLFDGEKMHFITEYPNQ